MQHSGEFSYLHYYRQVHGAEPFLNRVRQLGSDIFGHDASTLLTRHSRSTQPTGEPDPSLVTYTTVGEPRLKVYNAEDLALSLFHRRTPHNMRYYNRYNWVRNNAEKSWERVFAPPGTRKRDREKMTPYKLGLSQALHQLGYEYDVMPDAEVPFICDGLGLSIDNDYYDLGREVSLIPSVENKVLELFVKEADLCFRSVRSYAKLAAHPSTRMPLDVPCILLPHQADQDQLQDFNREVAKLLPIRVLAGPIQDIVHGSPR